MILALTLDKAGSFLLRLVIMMAGIFIIAYLTPKLAAFVDRLRRKNNPGEQPDEPLFKSPYESAPLPARVESDLSTENAKADEDATSSAENENN